MFNNTKELTKADKEFGEFKPYKKGLYILSVTEATEEETEERVWQGNGFVNTGNMIPQLTLKFALMNPDGSNMIADIDGKESVNPPYTVWINDSNLGWNKKTKGPKQGRAVLAALLNRPVDGDISFDDSQSLIGKQMSVYLGLEVSSTGKDRNVLVDINPVK